jgi:hypothetical protein
MQNTLDSFCNPAVHNKFGFNLKNYCFLFVCSFFLKRSIDPIDFYHNLIVNQNYIWHNKYMLQKEKKEKILFGIKEVLCVVVENSHTLRVRIL